MTLPDEQLTLESVAGQLGRAYESFDAAVRLRHLALLLSVQQPHDAAVEAVQEGPDQWAVVICAWDCIGALSVIAGLFAANHINIESVDVYTIRMPQAAPPALPPRPYAGSRAPSPIRPGSSRSGPSPASPSLPRVKLLDVFHVHSQAALAPSFWEQFRQELGQHMGLMVSGQREKAREAVIDRFSQVVGAGQAIERQLYPVAVELSNDQSEAWTRLIISSADTLGFLFAFSNALAMLEVNIERAEVRTKDGQVHDTFWLTDASGHKITSPERLHELRVAAALIIQFTYLLPNSPNPAQALRQFNALALQMLANPGWTQELRDMESARVLEVLAGMMGVSQFLWEDFLRMQHENLFPVLLDAPALSARKSIAQLREGLRQATEAAPSHEARARELNRFKDREMFRIDLRHITRRIGFREFAEELSDLAEVVVEQATALSHARLQERHGRPALPDGSSCPWAACALGKLGGRELGFGSDIEMLFVYQEESLTRGPEVIRNSTYFNDFVRAFLSALETRREGIFEIDLRLRPYGNKGALASSLEAFRSYYSREGSARQFERMALVRLRPVAGDPALGSAVVAARDAFVYSGAPPDIDDILHLR
ncbi:MAG: hypothetical protein HY681_01555 [Chloroflexi bacterium]|nr:hypothetical protein [Chloroflexota bacterium]